MTTNSPESDFSVYLQPFADYPLLKARISRVLNTLPENVLKDFLGDSRFRVTLETRTGKGWSLWMPVPGPVGSESRCVVLRERLDDATEEFACYVIAHEFAHAYLRNGGWGEITDREEAADALAASWGYHKPPRFGFLRGRN